VTSEEASSCQELRFAGLAAARSFQSAQFSAKVPFLGPAGIACVWYGAAKLKAGLQSKDI